MFSAFRQSRFSVAATSFVLAAAFVQVSSAQTLLEISGTQFPYFYRRGNLVDVAGVDETNHPIIRTYDLGAAGQPLIRTISPYADMTFANGRVEIMNYSPTGQHLGIVGDGIGGTVGIRATSLLQAPAYDSPLLLPVPAGQVDAAAIAKPISDLGSSVGGLNGEEAVFWSTLQNTPERLGGDYQLGVAADAPADLSIVVGHAAGGEIGVGPFRPVIWIDPQGANRLEVLDVGDLADNQSAVATHVSDDASVIIARRPMPNGGQFPTFIPLILMKDSPGAPTSAADYVSHAVATPDLDLLAGRAVTMLDDGLPVSFYNETGTDEVYVADHSTANEGRITATKLADWLGGRVAVPAAVAQADTLLDVHWTGHDRLAMTLAKEDDTVFFEFEAQSAATLGDVNADGALNDKDIDALTAMINGPHRTLYHDVTFDGEVDAKDRTHLIEDLLRASAGDSNLDQSFTTSDLVVAFQTGGYEDDIVGNATWRGGDWNGDLEFDSSDLVSAFVAGGFDANGASPAAVPEPTQSLLMLIVSGFFAATGLGRRR